MDRTDTMGREPAGVPGILLNALQGLLDGGRGGAGGASVLVAGSSASGPLSYGHHFHEVWEIFCPLRGSLRFACAGCAEQRLPAGTVLLVPPRCIHMGVHLLDQPRGLRFLIVTLPGDECPGGGLSLTHAGGPTEASLSADQAEQWAGKIHASPGQWMDWTAQALTEDHWGRACAGGMLRVFFAALAQALSMSHDEANPSRRTSSKVAEALAVIHARYYDPSLSRGGIASAVGMSESHLARLFRQERGVTLHQALTELRLRRAASLLRGSNGLIKEIAGQTGWQSPLYFSSAFTKAYGMAPTAYRQARPGGPTGKQG